MGYLLIWDIDGTLISTKGVGMKAMSMAFHELYNIKDAFKGVNMAGMLDAVIMKNVYAHHNIKDADVTVFYRKYSKILEQEVKKLDYSITCPGVKALLEALEGTGCFHNVLGTGNIEKGARIKLERDNLNRYFPTGGFGDKEMERWQIIQEAVVNAHNHFNCEFESENIYIIGDTPRDMECGKKLKAKSIGVATGPYSIRELTDCGADHVFENLLDTQAFLGVFK